MVHIASMKPDYPLTVVFYKSDAGKEPVRIWLKKLPSDDRKVIGEDINPDFSRARAGQEQGISVRRRSVVLLRVLNNAVPVPLWLAFGEEYQMPFFILHYYSLQFRT